MFICLCFHISTGLMRPDFYWSECPDVNCTVGLCFRMSTELYVNMSSGLCFQMSILDRVSGCRMSTMVCGSGWMSVSEIHFKMWINLIFWVPYLYFSWYFASISFLLISENWIGINSVPSLLLHSSSTFSQHPSS